jgi:hypothetical protein
MPALPRYQTPRDPTRRSLGGTIAAVADALGVPLQPFQRSIVDTAMEVDTDSGLLCYRSIYYSTPRQSGKTTLVWCALLARCLGWAEPQICVYSTTTGLSGMQKLLDTWVPQLMASELADQVSRVHKAAGNERIEFKNGSRLGLVGSLEHSGMGSTLDMAVIDEGAYADGRREMALRPALSTRDQGQLWVCSTAGDASASYWQHKVEVGRHAVEDGARRGTFYCEYSCAPGDQLTDEVLETCSPALGLLIDLERLREDIEALETLDALRAYGNVATVQRSEVFTKDQWSAINFETAAVALDARAYAIDLNPERDRGAIAVADGERNAVVLETGLSPTQLLEKTIEYATHADHPGRVAIDEHGPASGLIRDLQAGGVKVRHYSQNAIPPQPRAGSVTSGSSGSKPPPETLSVTEACGWFYDNILIKQLHIQRHQDLDAAVDGVEQRKAGDAWVWDRRSPGTDVSPLISVTLALHAAQRAGNVWVFNPDERDPEQDAPDGGPSDAYRARLGIPPRGR